MEKKGKIKAIINGTLIDGTTSDPLKNSIILIEDVSIIKVGKEGDFDIPYGAEVIDARASVTYSAPNSLERSVYHE